MTAETPTDRRKRERRLLGLLLEAVHGLAKVSYEYSGTLRVDVTPSPISTHVRLIDDRRDAGMGWDELASASARGEPSFATERRALIELGRIVVHASVVARQRIDRATVELHEAISVSDAGVAAETVP